MNPRARTAIAAGGGVIRRGTLLDIGVSPAEIRRLVNAGELLRLRRGVFTDADTWESLDEYAGHPLLRARAAIATMQRGWVLSHDSAAHAWGLPILHPRHPLVHVTRPGFTNAWTEFGVRHHLARFAARQQRAASGMPVLDLARTAVDIGRDRGVVHGVVACDAAMQRGVTRAELEAAYAVMEYWPHVKATRDAVALADPGAETVLESLTRLLVLDAGIGEPETQFPVRTAGGIKWADLRVGNLVIEAHGHVKLKPISAGGLATRPPDEVVRERLTRERLITDEGLVVQNVYWQDNWGERREQAITRLQRDAHEARQRYGAVLPERLVREAEFIRREYGDRRHHAPRSPA